MHVWRSLERRAAVAVGVRHVRNRTRRLRCAASAAYQFALDAQLEGPKEQELSASAAVAWRVHRLLAPLVELATVTRVRGNDEDGLRDRTQIYVIPGFNARPWPGMTLRVGVELPLTNRRTHEYAILSGLVKEF